MASSIDPTKPVYGTPTTASVRANFLAAKTEIEELQVSASDNGFKLTADDTAGLGAAQGGLLDGRIALDTDKWVLVRDTESTPPGTPFWGELGQRNTVIGDTASRPAFGSITDGDFVNLYYNTDTSKLQLDDGSSWIDIGPGSGGPGGGPTLTEELVTLFYPSDTSQNPVLVTHPAVPLTGAGSGRIRFSGIQNVAQPTTVENPYFDEAEDVRGAITQWHKNSGASGHFNAAVNSKISEGCSVSLNTVGFSIATLIPPGTADDSVVLESVPADSTPTVNYIRSQGYSGSRVYSWSYYDGALYHYAMPSVMSYVRETSDNTIDAADAAAMGFFKGVHSFVYSTGAVARGAVTVNGTDWIVFNGTDWSTVIDLADLETDGMVLVTDGSWHSWQTTTAGGPADLALDDGTASPPEGWGTLRTLIQAQGAGLHFRVAVGGRATSGSGHTIYNEVQWALPDKIQPFAIGVAHGGSPPWTVTRLTETLAEFTCPPGSSDPIRNVHCQVWT